MGLHFESLFLLIFLLCGSVVNGVRGDSTADECGSQINKVAPCLSYATGKSNTPTTECCTSVKDLKESNPKCLCYFIKVTHDGTGQAQSMGIQEAKLLQLPSACQLQNASVSFCPKLLGLSPSSPDAAIFTNITATTTPSAPTGTAAPEKTDSSNGIKHKPRTPSLMGVAIAIFICIFTAGSAAMLTRE